jgi:hypothetical protein
MGHPASVADVAKTQSMSFSAASVRPGAGWHPYFPLGMRRIRFSVAFSTACREYNKGK